MRTRFIEHHTRQRAEQRPRRRSASLCGALALFGVTGGLAGGLTSCGTIEPVAPAAGPITDPAQLYTSLTLDHPTITLSTVPPYNTLQLTATPRDALGNPMFGLPAPSYRSTDTNSVTVTAEGLVTALNPVTGVNVYATVTVGPVTHVDTAMINVTTLANPPKLASLSIHPVPSDSAIWPWTPAGQSTFGGYLLNLVGLTHNFSFAKPNARTLVPRVVDSLGNAIAGLLINYTSLDPAVATVTNTDGSVTIVHPGQVRMVAQTTAYGITKADTVTFTVTPPFTQDISISAGAAGVPGFWTLHPLGEDPSIRGVVLREIRIAPSGFVFWFNYLSDSVDIVFDDPTNVAKPVAVLCTPLAFLGLCGAGDMLVPPLDVATYGGDAVLFAVRVRQFPVSGVYPFHSTRLGLAGRVVVNPNLTD